MDATERIKREIVGLKFFSNTLSRMYDYWKSGKYSCTDIVSKRLSGAVLVCGGVEMRTPGHIEHDRMVEFCNDMSTLIDKIYDDGYNAAIEDVRNGLDNRELISRVSSLKVQADVLSLHNNDLKNLIGDLYAKVLKDSNKNMRAANVIKKIEDEDDVPF